MYVNIMAERDFEHVTHFPVKLWDVVNDESCGIFKWSSDGQSFFVDDEKYEQEIMDKYPGFVQISSFANLRRLLREYSFDWQNNDTGEFQFSHRFFKKGERDEIFNIRTKRKAIQVAIGHPVKPRRRSSRNGKNQLDKSKAWMQPVPSGKVNLRVDTLLRFPEKFWAVVNDCNDLLYWGENGDTVIVDDKKYEEGIMSRYPGFVQINSFANLRRLLREYGFSWSIRDNGFFEFSHSHMKKDRPELLKGVKTKRKAMKIGAPHPYLPFFKTEAPFYHHHHHHHGHGANTFTHGHNDQFEHFDSGLSTRSSPEVDQAIGTIQHNHTHTDSRHFHHHHATGDQSAADSPAVPHLYGFHPYRMMPSYTSLPASAGMAPQGQWPMQAPTGEKMEPPFFYSAWNHENQLRLPISCDNQSFADTEELEQAPPINDVEEHSNGDMRVSSTGSSESVYTCSSSKGSANEVYQDHGQLDASSQESTSPSFSLMHMQSSSEDVFSAPSAASSVGHCELQTNGGAYAASQCTAHYLSPESMNLNAQVCSVVTAEYSSSSSDMASASNDRLVEQDELNNNDVKVRIVDMDSALCNELEKAAEDNLGQTPPASQLLSNAQLVSERSYRHMNKIRELKYSDAIKRESVN